MKICKIFIYLIVQPHNHTTTQPHNTEINQLDEIAYDYDAILLVDEIEAALTYLDKVAINNENKEYKYKQEIRKAFVYDIAVWLDKITIKMPDTLRKIDTKTFKAFLKEVFLKSLVYGSQFKYWEAVDLDLYGLSNFPEFLIDDAKDRKLLLVEAQDYWFLMSQPINVHNNPFSVRRFLYEDIVKNNYVYLNGIALPKNLIDNKKAQQVILNQIARILSIDNNVSDELKKFALHIKSITRDTLMPILNKQFSFDGSNAEKVVARSVIRFEESLVSTVLQKLPRMFDIASNSEYEKEFLLYRLELFFRELLNIIQNFRLHPLTRHSFVAESLTVKLVALNAIIQKNKDSLCHDFNDNLELQNEFKKAMPTIRSLYKEFIKSHEDLDVLRSKLETYDNKKRSGGFLQKLGFGKPKYTQEDLDRVYKKLNNEFFLDIIRIAKSNCHAIVFIEHETDYKVDDNEYVRHYAIVNERYPVSRLPYVISLPEDREYFSLEDLRENLYWEIFTHIHNV